MEGAEAAYEKSKAAGRATPEVRARDGEGRCRNARRELREARAARFARAAEERRLARAARGHRAASRQSARKVVLVFFSFAACFQARSASAPSGSEPTRGHGPHTPPPPVAGHATLNIRCTPTRRRLSRRAPPAERGRGVDVWNLRRGPGALQRHPSGKGMKLGKPKLATSFGAK